MIVSAVHLSVQVGLRKTSSYLQKFKTLIVKRMDRTDDYFTM